jgi:hypothetical protein
MIRHPPRSSISAIQNRSVEKRYSVVPSLLSASDVGQIFEKVSTAVMVPSILLDDITAPMLSDRLQGRGFPVVATSAVLGSLIENLILNTHADII